MQPDESIVQVDHLWSFFLLQRIKASGKVSSFSAAFAYRLFSPKCKSIHAMMRFITSMRSFGSEGTCPARHGLR
jgi:hypothetical protein